MLIRALLFIALCIQPLHAAAIQEFSADYEIFYGDIHLGKANYRFSHQDGNSYRFDFDSKLRFLIFWDERSVSSDLVYEGERLRPTHYRHDRKGTGRDYREEILFDRPNDRIVTTYGKKKKELGYEKDIIDGLTMQLQMMLDLQRGIERPSYRIVDFNRLKTYEFSLAGTEVLNIQDRDYESIILQVVRKNERRKTQMWFAPERNYLPLQMVHFSKGKKKFNAHLVAYTEFDSGGD
ncbi:MAG: DUF3108 domain-containing protein [Gammaproteobacteria bacterium]|nr:MAG: DUF3108 domain-containing protein [Gammaproteobacteria bacterium]